MTDRKQATDLAPRPYKYTEVAAMLNVAREHADRLKRAIEFAGYLASSAERYMAAVNSFEAAREGQSDKTADDATMAMTEAYTRLASDIYEFRKRIP